MKSFTCLFSVDYMVDSDDIRTEYGLLFADDFRDAMNQLEGELYGTDLVKINSMELFDTPSAVFSKETFALMQKEIEQGV